MKEIALDTGPITLYFSENPPKKILYLFDLIKTQQIRAFMLSPILVEVYKHLCIANGKNFAEHSILSIYNLIPLQIVPLSQNIILKAGELKCKFRKTLSYIDCLGISLSLLSKYEFHTTEKNLPSIASLKIVTYEF